MESLTMYENRRFGALCLLLTWVLVPGRTLAAADGRTPELEVRPLESYTLQEGLPEIPASEPAVGTGFAIPWSSIDGGGGVSNGGAYRLTATVGQADAGRAAGGAFTLTGGFLAGAELLRASLALMATVEPTSLPEPGGLATVSLEVENTGNTELELAVLSDDLGGLNGEGTCSLPQTLAEGTSYACSYDASFPGNAGDTPGRTLTASDGGSANDSAAVTVSLSDVLPAIAVVKMASPTEIPAPGGEITFSVAVSNIGGVEAVSLFGLVDDIHGNLDGRGTCSVPQALGVASTYGCQFTAEVLGAPGDVEIDTITATAQDDEGNPAVASDTASVTILDAIADLAITKTDGRVYVAPGDELTYTVRVENLGPAGVISAQVFDPLPAALTGCSWTCAAVSGSCTAAGSGDLSDTPSLDSGGTATYSVTCTVLAGATGTVTNTATVDPPSGVQDPQLANNSATDNTVIADPIFADGFESGDTSGWSNVVGFEGGSR